MSKDVDRTILFFINIQTYIDIALGISAIIISTVLQIRLKEDFSYFNGYQENISSLMKTMWALSSFILFWGLITYICCYRQIVRPTWQKIFPLSIFIWTLVFGIFVFIAKGQFNNMNCIYVFLLIKKIAQKLNGVKTQNPHLFGLNRNFAHLIVNAIQQTLIWQYNLVQKIIPLLKCHQGIELPRRYLSHVEEKFECAGWCSNQKYYMFSDINNQVPQTKTKGCSVYAAKYIDNNLFILGVFSFVVMAFQAFYLLVSGIFHHIVKRNYRQID